ncbi:MAG TPA: class I SAM-dependent methyltransferase [Verrucomicrobiae bacterium]|nr:class I SAM-dependent methyltransferase [Verrucomicrobiae bacterium]
MDFQRTEAALRQSYGQMAAKYRSDDEIEVTSAHHQRLAARLGAVSASFERPISVLDVGCGTGRFFYSLSNVDRLVGMDISPEMLQAAKQPVNANRITARNIQLIQGNVFFASFPPRSFDLIYSFGMFGHGCPLTREVCDKLHSWLVPGGQVYFDTVDIAGLPWWDRTKKQVRKALYPGLPQKVRNILDQREHDTPFFGMTRRELEDILRSSRFSSFAVISKVCESPLWQGRHLECRACVSGFTATAPASIPPGVATPSTKPELVGP